MPQNISSSPFQTLHAHESARVAVVSLRRTQRDVWRALPFEFEDTIARLDDADIVAPASVIRHQTVTRRLSNKWRDLTQPATVLPGQSPLSTTGRMYEMLFLPLGDLNELLLFDDLRPLLSCARVRVAWVAELWAKNIQNHPRALRLLKQFDVVAVAWENSVEPLQRAIGVPCVHLPAAVDVLTSMPADLNSPRPIDIYQMGRRAEATHQAFLNLARERNWFYLYDTSWGKEMNHAAEHRSLTAETIKRTQFFVTNRAKVDVPDQTGGQHEVSFRTYEGSAAGTIMIGDIPQTPAYKELFGWDDAIIPMPFGTMEVAELLDSLLAQPARMRAIRAKNVRQALLQHDWVYRWNRLLACAGLTPRPAAVAREAQLRGLADQITRDHLPSLATGTTGADVVRLRAGS